MPVTAATPDTSMEYVQRLLDAGYEDVLVLQWDTAEEVLTNKRVELIKTIRAEEPSSIRDLARRVDRDPSAVMKDLKLLFQDGVIEFEQDGNRKIPRLAHEHIVTEPVL